MSIDMTTPQAMAAQQFMAHKGINLKPYDVDELDDQPCWYFYYELPEGELELEVFYDAERREWDTTVTTFTLAG